MSKNLVYKEENKCCENNKSWKIYNKLVNDYILKFYDLIAVDSDTGECICTLLAFSENGRILTIKRVNENLKKYGYNPHEHGHQFDERGRIVIN